jgi:hypothetical protein
MRFSVGGQSIGIVWLDDWPENRIDDGIWHHIRIDYYNRVYKIFKYIFILIICLDSNS